MGDVVSLEQAKIDRGPHLSGPARCLRCDHRYVMVMPITGKVTGLECPACHCMTSSLIALFTAPAGEPMLTCSCGNQHFLITPRRAICANCGQSKTPDYEHPTT